MGNFAKTDYRSFLARVSDLLEQARRKTVRQVNTVITYTYWKIGKLVVEEEQRGKERAKYGEYLIQRLSKDLTRRFGRGFTERNLWAIRQFYLTYPILHALRAELTWTHYRLLSGIRDTKARSFYEIEAVSNSWSTRELDRQINSLLFERLALSKDKKKVMELAKRGQIIEKSEDALGGLSNRVFVSKYKLYLPTKKELEIEVKKETARIKLTLPKKKENSRD